MNDLSGSMSFAAAMDSLETAPILIDIGAAGASPGLWRPVAKWSILVRFDPESRVPPEDLGQAYSGLFFVPKAVVADDQADEATFILTEYPPCSSVLPVNANGVSSYAFRDLFRPVKTETVPATSLNRVISEYTSGRLDWLKLDTQGTDLRLIQSLSTPARDRLLAVDIEPGLIPAYVGEDSFTACHDWLLSEGFWLSDLRMQRYVKGRPEVLDHLAKRTNTTQATLTKRLKTSPTAPEARYFREATWHEQNTSDCKYRILAAIFGLLDDQVAYAADMLNLATAVEPNHPSIPHLWKVIDERLQAA